MEFSKAHSSRRTQTEVRDALEKSRDRPRKKGSNMPNLKVRVTFELSPEKHDVLEKAVRKAAAEMNSLGEGRRVEPQEALLFMARRWLETDPEGTPQGRKEKEDSIDTILYHSCPTCRSATLPTAGGPVDILPEVERVEGEARKVTIPEREKVGNGSFSRGGSEKRRPEPPNSRTLRRRVLLHDGRACGNPHCRRKLGLHAHHNEFRSAGGETALSNEIAVCSICHSLPHSGVLQIEGNPLEELR